MAGIGLDLALWRRRPISGGGAGASAPDFGDESIPTPLHWYDAGAAVYSDAGGTTAIANGERVGSIENYGSQSLNVAPAGNGPIYRTGGQNGRPYLEVTAGEHLADLAGVSQPTGLLSFNPYTIFMVTKNVRSGANYIVGSPVAGENKVTVKTSAGVTTWYKSAVTYNNIQPDNDLRIYMVGKAAGAAGGFFRGNPVTPHTAFSQNSNYSPGSASAQFLRHTGDAGNFEGDFYEFIYFNSELSAAQCAVVMSYLEDKHAFVVNDGVPDINNVVLLSGFEGSDGSTTFVDESSFARTMTAQGNAQIDTAFSQFGASSALFDGVGDWLTMADSDDFAFGYGAFTIDAFIRPTVVGVSQAIVSQFRGLGSQRAFAFALYSGGLRFYMSTGGAVSVNSDTTAGVDIQAAHTFDANTTYHVRVDRTAADPVTGGSVLRLYVNGVMIAKRTSSANAGVNINMLDSTSEVWVGGINNNSGEWPWNGWIDELRAVKGEALCASDAGFTVPTEAYPRPESSGVGISFVGSTESDPISVSSPTISLTGLTGGSDSAPQAGDFVVICITQTVSSTTTSEASITSAGYTEQVDVLGADASGIKARFHVFTKRLTTAETEVVLNTERNPAVTIHVFRGVDEATPLDVVTVTDIGDNTGRPNPPAITPVTAGAWVFACGGGGWNTVTPFTSSDLAGFVSAENDRSSFKPNTGAGYFEWVSGAFDPAQFGGGNTSTNSAWGAATLAFRPA